MCSTGYATRLPAAIDGMFREAKVPASSYARVFSRTTTCCNQAGTHSAIRPAGILPRRFEQAVDAGPWRAMRQDSEMSGCRDGGGDQDAKQDLYAAGKTGAERTERQRVGTRLPAVGSEVNPVRGPLEQMPCQTRGQHYACQQKPRARIHGLPARPAQRALVNRLANDDRREMLTRLGKAELTQVNRGKRGEGRRTIPKNRRGVRLHPWF